MSDDLDFEELELDEDVLKALQDTEDRYTLTTGSQSLQQSSTISRTSVSKVKSTRVVPTKPRVPVFRQRPQPVLDDFDDTPDISVAMDGSYLVQGVGTTTMLSRTTLPSYHASGSPSLLPTGLSRAELSYKMPLLGNLEKSPSFAPKTSANGSTSKRAQSLYSPPPIPVTAGGSATLGSKDEPQLIFDSTSLASELRRLQGQVEELQASRDAARRELENVKGSQFARDGEIATLRRAMQKQVDSYTEVINKLRVEKNEADARRGAQELELSNEIDRLKTRLIFKQQEYESAAIRSSGVPPSTARRNGRRTYSQQETPAPPQRFYTTPDRGQNSMQMPETPIAFTKATSTKKTEPTPFPGFFDSFSQSGLKLSSNIKGKQREVIPETPPRNFRRESPVASLSRNIESLDDVDRNPMLAANPELANGHPEQGTIPSDDPLNGQLRTELSWTDELLHIFFSSTSKSTQISTASLALQLVLSNPFNPGNDTQLESWKEYQSACAGLLNVLSTVTERNRNFDDLSLPVESLGYQKAVSGACSFLLVILETLLRPAKPDLQDSFSEAVLALLHLITSLVTLLPTVCEYFLKTSEPRPILAMLWSLLDCYSPRSDIEPGVSPQLNLEENVGASALVLVKCLIWNAPSLSYPSITAFVADSHSLSNLLAPFQPTWLKLAGVRVLTIASTRPHLIDALVACEMNESGQIKSTSIENLCTYFANPGSLTAGPDGSNPTSLLQTYFFIQAWEFLQSILTFLSALVILHGKGLHLLQTTPSLAPSLILCLAEVSNWFWEEDSFANASPLHHNAVVGVLIPALQLVHFLFYHTTEEASAPGDHVNDLPHVLFHAAAQPAFSAIDHTYIVTMARLGYADVPDWLGAENVRIIDEAAELARELLELLVGGPEGDLIVEAYVAPSSQEHRLTPEPYDNLKRNYSACREMAPPRTVDEGDNIVEESDEGDVTDEEMSDG